MGANPDSRLILASGSRARKSLLEQAGRPFTVIVSHVDEPTGAGITDIRRFVHEVAWSKAAEVANRVSDGIILAADTVGWIDGQVIGKPHDEADARRILTTLGGREHELWSGVILWRKPDDLQLAWQECSRVFFRKLTPEEMDVYLATRTWDGCSGAYAVLEKDDPYVQVVAGSVSNVVGLPMESLERLLPMLYSSGGSTSG
jgi:septum formation protein